MASQSASAITVATTGIGSDSMGSHVKAKSNPEFKMGGYENLNEDGIEIVDNTYLKYAELNAKGKRGFQVRVLNIPAAIVD